MFIHDIQRAQKKSPYKGMKNGKVDKFADTHIQSFCTFSHPHITVVAFAFTHTRFVRLLVHPSALPFSSLSMQHLSHPPPYFAKPISAPTTRRRKRKKKMKLLIFHDYFIILRNCIASLERMCA